MVPTTIMSRTFFLKHFFGPHVAEDSEGSVAESIIQQKQ
jgi:hypothetical protein